MIGHRRVIPEVTYLITKKCLNECFLLKPTRKNRQALRYELARRAKKYGIKIHAFCFMSNHFHLVVTDRRGNLPAFMRDFLTNTSKALQVAMDEVDTTIWAKKRYSSVRLLDLDAATRKIAYTLLNPTRAELTKPKDWPGVTSANLSFGESVTIHRPKFYFGKKSPESVELRVDPVSPEFGLSSRAQIRACNQEIEADVTAAAQSIEAEAERAGRKFAGAEKVRSTPVTKRGKRKVGERIPRFASRDRDLLMLAMLQMKQFEQEHEAAAEKFRRGERETIFPYGTYGYRVVQGVRVALTPRSSLTGTVMGMVSGGVVGCGRVGGGGGRVR